MKKAILLGVLLFCLIASGASAQMMGGGQHMMNSPPPLQASPPQGDPWYGMGSMMTGGWGMNPGMMGGWGMNPGMMGWGMNPGMMGWGMNPGMMGWGMNPGMMGGMMNPGMMGWGMNPAMMGNMMGYGAPCTTGSWGKVPMMGYGTSSMAQGAGADVEKQRKFMKETTADRRKLHDLMFDYMEAQWDPEAKSEKVEKLGKEMQDLQKKLYEKYQEALK